LDGPVGRVQMEPVAHPINPGLEAAAVPNVAKIIESAKSVMSGLAPAPRRPQINRKAEAVAQAPVVKEASPSSAQPAAAPQPSTPVGEGEPIIMPHGDLTVSEAKVINWLKNVGDVVAAGEGVVEVETDKAVLQIDAPIAGRLTQVLVPVGDIVKMGETIGFLSPA